MCNLQGQTKRRQGNVYTFLPQKDVGRYYYNAATDVNKY